jgi:hypothetical protein
MSHHGTVRECKWCGQKFTPESRDQRHCDESCYASYFGYNEEPEVMTREQINQYVQDYAIRHDVEISCVDVNCCEDPNGNVVGIKLSLDTYGKSRGCGETYGIWG